MEALDKIIELIDCLKKLLEIDPDRTLSDLNKARTILAEKIKDMISNLVSNT